MHEILLELLHIYVSSAFGREFVNLSLLSLVFEVEASNFLACCFEL